MYKLMVLYPHPESPADFRQYYTERHLPLASQLPLLLSSRHAFEPAAIGAQSPYFCIWEGDFGRAEDMQASMASQIGQVVANDVPNYATGGALILHYEVQPG